jgi:DnaK suppressor protein
MAAKESQILLRLPSELKEKLERAADREKVTLVAFVRSLLEESLAIKEAVEAGEEAAVTPAADHLAPRQLEIYKRRIRKKSVSVAEELADELAKQNATLADFPLPATDPNKDPVIKLRKFLDHLNAIMTRFDEGTYGYCEACGDVISKYELDELPWATICLRCALKGKVRGV